MATAGATRSGTSRSRRSRKATGIKYKHVTYDGGNPAVVATVAGETEVMTQLAVEEADMMRAQAAAPARP